MERGAFSMVVEILIFLGFAMYLMARVRVVFSRPGGPWTYVVPGCLTTVVLLFSTRQMIVVGDNTALLWCRVWTWLLIIWLFWLSDTPPNTVDPLSGRNQQIVFFTFASLEVSTLFLWVCVCKIYPVLAYLCLDYKCALSFFWRVRPSRGRPGWMSYTPNGRCCSRRHLYRYTGETDVDGHPSGLGIWYSDHYDGEVVKGAWRDGVLVAPFVSRTFGTGAMSKGLCIGYATTRIEDLTVMQFVPKRLGQFRYGCVSVECSIAGGFLSHLPQLFEHEELSLPAVLTRLTETATLTRGDAPEHHSERRDEEDDSRIVNTDSRVKVMETGKTFFRQTLFSSCLNIGIPAGKSAVVFIHGYNCPTSDACMRLAQLLALGKFNPGLLPFVFSWSCGQSVSYFEVRRQLPDLAKDLVPFLRDLRARGVEEVHLLAHSLGTEIITAAIPDLFELTRSEGLTKAEGSPLRIPTLTLLNATCPRDQFVGIGDQPGQLRGLLQVSNRVTLYCDSDDGALRIAEGLGGPMAIGRYGPKIFSAEDRYCDEHVDIVDCTSMDANVHEIRHSYFDLNSFLVSDLHELITYRRPARSRSQLVRMDMVSRGNVFSFLAPPVFIAS